MRKHYDYVIVGGGSAGSALGNRLSADPSTNVLVLEAGRNDSKLDPFIHMPAALPYPIGNKLYDWKYESDPEPHMGGRRVFHARGKVLGGSSSINGMIFQRGNPMDYERWAADPGMETWDYAHCLPYFKRMENCLAGGDAYRGDDGPLVLERGPAENPLFGAFFDAVQQAGYPLTSDVNGYRQEGFARFDRNIHRGRRLSAARAYLHPAMSRDNLTVETSALVHRVVFDGTQAVGVEYSRRGRTHRVGAGEVILCGGAFNSPQLLQLSGIGPAALLSSRGIPVIHDLAVGEGLQDHFYVRTFWRCNRPITLNDDMASFFRQARIALQYLLKKRGPLTVSAGYAAAFVRTRQELKRPDAQIYFINFSTARRGGVLHSYDPANGLWSCWGVRECVDSRPSSTGWTWP